MADPSDLIAFQGEPGAYSDLACRRVFPRMTTLPCAGFEEAYGRGAREPGAARHAAGRELGSGARRRHPPSAAQFRPAHHRRAFRAGRAPPAWPYLAATIEMLADDVQAGIGQQMVDVGDAPRYRVSTGSMASRARLSRTAA